MGGGDPKTDPWVGRVFSGCHWNGDLLVIHLIFWYLGSLRLLGVVCGGVLSSGLVYIYIYKCRIG